MNINKKIFASALFIVGAFVSTFATAVTYDNSVTDALGIYVQTGNAKVAAGGGAARGNDLIITAAGGTPSDIPADAEIIIRLPKGLNFDGEPSYLVVPAVATTGLTLKDGSQFGDPTLDDPGITLFDANEDGGMDRAVVVVGAAALAGDSLTISVNVSADATATAGVKKASIIVNAGLAVTQDVVEVVAGFTEPVSGASGTKLSTVDQGANPNVGVTTASFTVTVPAGTAGGSKVTFTPQSKLTFATGGTSITYTVSSPLKADPFTVASGAGGVFAAGPGTATLSFTVTGASTTSLADDTQVTFTVDQVDTESGGAIGARGLAVSGAVTGVASLVDAKLNGSTASLTSLKVDATNTNPAIVAGSAAPQALPSIVVAENFDGDAGSIPGTSTITITAGTGLSFDATSVPTFAGGTWAATSTVTATKVTVTILTNDATVNLTIDGLLATASSTASGDLTLTVGSPGVGNDSTTGPSDTLTVATATPVGTVDITGPKTPAKTGPGSAALAGAVTLKETTYGSLTIASQTQVQDAFFRITPSSNAKITAVTTLNSLYPATSPTITACVAETGVTTGAYICEVTAESTSLTPGTSAITVTVTYSAKSTAAIGSTIDVTFDGNAGVDGTATLATVGVATTASKGVVPDLEPGNTSAFDLAPVTIKENFTGAVTAGNEFRLIAPAGVAFQDVTAIAAQSPGIVTATLTATFNPNDTLVMTTVLTQTVTFTPKAVIASTASGWLSFDLVDGNIDAERKSGITGESVMIAYADGTLGAVDAGADAAVNVGFNVANTASGGLAPYTVKSGTTAVATAAVVGDVVTVTAVATGVSIITVTDELGGSDTYVVTVGAGAAQSASEKAAVTASGASTTATFTGGATTDGGTSYGTEFTSTDDVTIVGTINVAVSDQGSDGEIHVAILSVTDTGTTLGYLNEDGNIVSWDQTIAGLGAAEVAKPLAASHNVVVFSGNLAAGTHRIALAYSVDGGDLVFTTKALTITVTE